MNKIREFVLCLLLLLSFCFGDTQVDNDKPSWEYPFVQAGEVDINIKTEKDNYYLGEMITLELEICNLTDKRIALCGIRNGYRNFFGVDVLSPYRPRQVIKYKDYYGSEKEYVKEELMSLPVPRSLLGKQAKEAHPWYGGSDIIISPYGKVKFRLPLSLIFDFSVTHDGEYGEYTVNINCDLLKWDLRNDGNPRKELVIKKSCKFELELKDPADISFSRTTADNMLELLGRERIIEVLCDEAEALISGFMGRNEEEWRTSVEYERLKRILSTSCRAADIHHRDRDLDYLDEKNAMNLDEFNKLLQRCRARRLKMFLEETDKLRKAKWKMEDEYWKNSPEYSRFKTLMGVLCSIAEEEKNLDYLEKNNIVDDDDELCDLLRRCEAKLRKKIPFFNE